eukprot:g2890.t1
MSESEEERRPRPIGVADESEEGDSDTEHGGAAPAGADGPAAETTGEAAPEETTAKKRSKRMPAFSENDLVKDKGLWQIYKDFPQKCQYKGKGREAEFLRSLMVAYKEWGFQLCPGVAFEDLASRTEKLGGKERTRRQMQELRDAERDRVVEAKYGREAVDNVRAQEAAKLMAKEAKAAEEREDEELAGSRYMEVDEEEGGAPPPSSSAADAGDVGGGKGDGGGGEGQTVTVLSEEARQRMEVNRRLALERLRLKKEEAAAASAAAAPGFENQAVGATNAMPADDNDDEPTDLMEVDGGGDGGGADDDFEDDEAALAEMEADQITASTAKPPTSAETPPAQTVAVPAASAAAAHPTDTAQDAHPEGMTSAESTTRGGDAGTSGGDPGSSGAAAETAAANNHAPAPVSVVLDGTAGGPMDDATPTRAGATPEPSKPASGLSEGEKERRADDGGEASRGGAGSSATAGSEAQGNAVAGDEAVGVGADDALEPTPLKGQQSFSSPAKRKAAGGLPLSPLGNMLASTDLPAEGGSIAVRAPLGGLFSDENV